MHGERRRGLHTIRGRAGCRSTSSRRGRRRSCERNKYLSAGAPDVGEEGSPGVATLHLHATDAGGAEWTLDTAGRTLTRRHSSGDVAVRGAAWALARWCWGRPVIGELEVFGDLTAAEAWRSTVVP
ncbi:MAG: hypothetical protein ACLQNG_08605 [Acidimicrobiales bacterium]